MQPPRLTRSLLATLLLVPLLASPARCAEKIEGAFGLKLGQVYEPTTPPVGETGQDQHEYAFTPAAPNPMFSTYQVYISPASHVVCRIVARGEAADRASYEKIYNRLAAVLNSKYSDVPQSAASVLQSPRLVSVGSDYPSEGKITYTLSYSDAFLERQAAEEQNKLDREKLAQKQKQLLEETDATGL